jgi:NitT/TauT family transport system substrate-binding protein
MQSNKFKTLVVLVVASMLLISCAGGAATTVAPTEVPAQPTQAPVQPTQAVASPTEVPATPTEAMVPTETSPKPTETSAPAELTKVSLTLNFLAGGPQAGFMYAKQLGYYKDAGLDVTIQEGQGSATTAQLVATGGAEIGFADGPAAMQVRAKGGAVKIVAVILQTNGFAIISLKDQNITKVSDLIGKTLAVQPGTAQTALLDAVFKANNVDMSKVNIVNIDPSALVGTLLQGKVDAILAGADFQSVQIRDRGYDINELFYRDIGVPTVGLSVVVNDDMIQKNPDVIKRFVAASLKGWDAARKDPEAASQAVVDQFVSGDKQQILEQLQVDLKLVCAPGATTLGMPPEENWTKTFDLLTKYQGLPTDIPITDYYTTEFIPADAPTCP